MPILTRDSFKAINDRPPQEVDMSQFTGWEGVTVLLRPLSGVLRSEIEREWINLPAGEKLPPQFKERVLARCIVGEDGAVLFDSPEGIAELAEKNGSAIEHLYTIAAKANGLTKTAVEDAAKNSPAPSEGAS